MLAAFSIISPTSAALAVASIGVLFALHHLRTQPARQTMATLIFWRQAIRPDMARVPWSRRFTHRKTFTLLACILLLICAALTADRWGSINDAGRQDVIVVDAGAAMAADSGDGGTWLEYATDTARADMPGMDGTPALIAAANRPVLLSGRDDSSAVVDRRLNELRPQAGTSASTLALQLAGGVQGTGGGTIHWYTAADELPAGLPAELAKRVVIHSIKPANAVAIVGATFEPTADDGARGTLRARLAGKTNATMTIDATVNEGTKISQPVNSADVSFPDIAADGSVVAAHLNGAPGAAITHEVRFRLPDWRSLTFRFEGAVPSALKLGLLASGTETADGAIFVTDDESKIPSDAKAAIVVVRGPLPIAADDALTFADDSMWGRGLLLEQARAASGPAVSGAGSPVLLAGGAVVARLDDAASHKRLRLSTALLGDGADLPKRAAFPILLNRLCGALIGRSVTPQTVASLRIALDPLWPGAADEPVSADAGRLIVVADRPPVPPPDTTTATPERVRTGRWNVRWTEIVLSLALGLLVVEGLLFAARKVV